jgi:hypothetical protein
MLSYLVDRLSKAPERRGFPVEPKEQVERKNDALG